VILFGSYAYGRPTPESDVDLLVIMDSTESAARRSSAVSLACRPKLLAMDVLVRTPQEVEDRLQRGDTFLRDILARGRVLYERRLG
jgi:predicted nucleotidyltransferase